MGFRLRILFDLTDLKHDELRDPPALAARFDAICEGEHVVNRAGLADLKRDEPPVDLAEDSGAVAVVEQPLP